MKRPLRTVVADDEPLALGLLCAALDACGGVHVVRRCENGREVLAAVRELEPDMLVLDVEMPGMTGFDTVRALQSDTLPLVIFVTAFSEYAVDAFDVNAVDYVLKPIEDQRLAKALKRARARLGDHARPRRVENKGRVMQAIMDMDDGKAVAGWHGNHRIALRDGARMELLDQGDIVWVDAAGDYMCLHDLGNRTHVIRSTMNDLLKRLDDPRFARVHRSTAVNLERIESADLLAKGEYLLGLQGGSSVKVSRNYSSAVRNYLNRRSV